MKTDKKETLDKYPTQRGILPTRAGFSGSKELDAYEMMRRKFLTSKLYIFRQQCFMVLMFSNSALTLAKMRWYLPVGAPQ